MCLITAKRPDIITETERENMHTDRCGNTCPQKRHAKGRGKEAKNTRFYVWRYNESGT
jgi:hypothetical protein